MKKCSKCGSINAPNAKFCSNCGKVFTVNSPSLKIFGVIACIFIGVCILIAISTAISQNSTSSQSSPEIKAKTIPAKYDEAAAVIKMCGKPNRDHPQELNAGAGSEGRALVYRKYNTELWFYRGPESRYWMLMSALVANGDDSMTVEQASKRMPCMKSGFQDHFREPQNEEERVAAEQAQAASRQAEADEKKKSDENYKEMSFRASLGAASIYKAMRNPESLKLESVLGMKDGTICYEYRAQNGFGGMNREFAVLLPKAERLTTSAGAWNSRCAHKTGSDLTFNAEQMMKPFSNF